MRFSLTVGNYNRVRIDTKTVRRYIYNDRLISKEEREEESQEEKKKESHGQ